MTDLWIILDSNKPMTHCWGIVNVLRRSEFGGWSKEEWKLTTQQHHANQHAVTCYDYGLWLCWNKNTFQLCKLMPQRQKYHKLGAVSEKWANEPILTTWNDDDAFKTQQEVLLPLPCGLNTRCLCSSRLSTLSLPRSLYLLLLPSLLFSPTLSPPSSPSFGIIKRRVCGRSGTELFLKYV